MNSSHWNGAVSESIVEAELQRLGYPVAIPKSDQPYDMIVDLGDDLARVQIKTIFTRDDGSGERRFRAELRPRSNGERSSYDAEDVDAFAFYNQYIEEVYWLWFDEAPNTEVSRTQSSWDDHLMWSKLNDFAG